MSDDIFDKTVGSGMSKMVNENWKEIWTALKTPVEVTFSKTLDKILNAVFNKTPFNELFKV